MDVFKFKYNRGAFRKLFILNFRAFKLVYAIPETLFGNVRTLLPLYFLL